MAAVIRSAGAEGMLRNTRDWPGGQCGRLGNDGSGNCTREQIIAGGTSGRLGGGRGGGGGKQLYWKFAPRGSCVSWNLNKSEDVATKTPSASQHGLNFVVSQWTPAVLLLIKTET